MDNLLELKQVSKSFESFTLKNISFSLPKGFIMGFIGANGAGKTTTIKLILNMLHKDSGTINVFDKDNKIFEEEIKEKIGVVMDMPFFMEEWNLIHTEKAISRFYKNWNMVKYKKLLADFNLNPKKRIKELSRGMKIKLMIAVALSHEADLLILDEPTSGLDTVTRNELMDILRLYIENDNKGVFFSTHITSDLESIADYITFISNGEMIYTGTKDELLENYFIIKGGTELDSKLKQQIIGYRKHNLGFDGLVKKEMIKLLPNTVIAEPSTLDDIILRFNSGDKLHE